MRIKNPRQASPNEVKISRQGDGAIIEFTDPTISTTHFKIGPQIRQMSDQAILDMFNGMIAARDRLAAEYENIVIEIPPGCLTPAIRAIVMTSCSSMGGSVFWHQPAASSR